MKSAIRWVSSAFLAVVLAAPAVLQAAEEETIKGEGLCAKCELGEAKSCQNAIRVKKDGKSVVYLLEQNDISKGFHKNLCSGTAKVVAKGKVSEKDGKKILVASKIDLDK